MTLKGIISFREGDKLICTVWKLPQQIICWHENGNGGGCFL